MKFKIRTWETRFKDPAWVNGIGLARPSDERVDPRDADGTQTVIIHGKRVSGQSPRLRWPHAELWGVTRCNVMYWHESLPDWTRWFDLHPVESTDFHRGIKAKRPEAWDWYTRQTGGRPIYLLETHPDVPDSVRFPREAVQDHFGGSTQFTVSVDWMIAFAIHLGFQRIVFNGIGTRFDADFQYEHQGILHWIGYARARLGWENVVIEGPSCYHMPEKVYGYEAAAPKLDPRAMSVGV